MRKKLSQGRQIREIIILSFFAGINFCDLAATEKLNVSDIVFFAEKKYQRRKKNGN